MRKAYATLNNISVTDASTPRSYFLAMGLDYDSFAENAADLKVFANKFSMQLERLLPIRLDLIDRTIWMFSNYFADSDDAKAAVYTFALPYITQYNAIGKAQQLGLAVFAPGSATTGMTYDSFLWQVSDLTLRLYLLILYMQLSRATF